MGQIVAYSQKDSGNFVLEIKPALRHTRKRTTQVAGTDWSEPLPGLYGLDPEGNKVPLTANVSIRYSNHYKANMEVPVVPMDGANRQARVIPFR